MSKEKYYSVKSSNGQHDEIQMHKNKDTGCIEIHMGYEELEFTVKECKEIINNLKKCMKD